MPRRSGTSLLAHGNVLYTLNSALSSGHIGLSLGRTSNMQFQDPEPHPGTTLQHLLSDTCAHQLPAPTDFCHPVCSFAVSKPVCVFVCTFSRPTTVGQQAPEKGTLRKRDDYPRPKAHPERRFKVDPAREATDEAGRPYGARLGPLPPTAQHAVVIALFSRELQIFPGVY